MPRLISRRSRRAGGEAVSTLRAATGETGGSIVSAGYLAERAAWSSRPLRVWKLRLKAPPGRARSAWRGCRSRAPDDAGAGLPLLKTGVTGLTKTIHRTPVIRSTNAVTGTVAVIRLRAKHAIVAMRGVGEDAAGAGAVAGPGHALPRRTVAVRIVAYRDLPAGAGAVAGPGEARSGRALLVRIQACGDKLARAVVGPGIRLGACLARPVAGRIAADEVHAEAAGALERSATG